MKNIQENFIVECNVCGSIAYKLDENVVKTNVFYMYGVVNENLE